MVNYPLLPKRQANCRNRAFDFPFPWILLLRAHFRSSIYSRKMSLICWRKGHLLIFNKQISRSWPLYRVVECPLASRSDQGTLIATSSSSLIAMSVPHLSLSAGANHWFTRERSCSSSHMSGIFLDVWITILMSSRDIFWTGRLGTVSLLATAVQYWRYRCRLAEYTLIHVLLWNLFQLSDSAGLRHLACPSDPILKTWIVSSMSDSPSSSWIYVNTQPTSCCWRRWCNDRTWNVLLAPSMPFCLSVDILPPVWYTWPDWSTHCRELLFQLPECL